jgi:ferrous iron transport protein A
MPSSLSGAREGELVRIVALGLEGEVASWLAAVGLHEGESIVVLRRAVFGGPIHVRTGSGGEFAVARELASRITVTRELEEPRVTSEAAE